MNRREAISRMAILAGGIWIAQSCISKPDGASIELTHINISKSMEDVLNDIVNSILPMPETNHTAPLNLHLFVMKMVDDCHAKEDQAIFEKGLTSFIKGNWDGNAIPFATASAEQQIAMVELLNQYEASDIKKCYEIIKRRTIQGFLNSEYVMKGELPYELVPGRYNGFFKVS